MPSKRKLSFILVGLLMLASSANIFATSYSSTDVMNVPFTMDELSIIQNYLFNNITTDTHVIVKTDEGRIIRSIPGAVLASPSNKGVHFSQDYQFHWIRDAAITMNEIAHLYSQASGSDKKRIKSYLLNYVDFENKAQKQISKEGEQTLGQPKYNIDGTIWEGEWMRPQNDGPALRAATIVAIANLFLQEGQVKYVRENLFAMMTLDLNYVTTEWKNKSFDLWEEVNDEDHFFTKMVQRKALYDGAALARRLGKEQQANNYENVAQQITASLQKHWNQNIGYFSETIHQQYFKGGGLNSAIILGVLYGNLNDANDPLAINSDKVMSSIYFIRNAFAGLYKINVEQHKPPLLGRYPNDIYDGDQFVYGNPWILTSNALAQYYYSLAKILLQQRVISVTKNNLLFFQQINPDLVNKEEVIYATDNPDKFYAITNSLIAEGDKILRNIKHYSTCYPDRSCYHFAEQVDRAEGTPTSAKDLTWGYATLLSAIQARAEAMAR